MPIRIVIEGETVDDLVARLLEFHDRFNVVPQTMPVVERVSSTQMRMSTDVDFRDDDDLPKPPKRTRRQQAALAKLDENTPIADIPPVPAEAPAPAAQASDAKSLAVLKDKCIKVLSDIYVEEGGAIRVTEIIRKHGGGVKKAVDVPPEKFVEIAAEIGVA